MKKKITCLIVMFCFVSSSVLTSTAETEVMFSDLPKTHWAYETVMQMVQSEIIDGYPDGSFKPEEKVTRAELAKMVTFTLGLMNGTPEYYDDLNPEHDSYIAGEKWYTEFAGSVAGYMPGNRSDGMYFDGNVPATRLTVLQTLFNAKAPKEGMYDTSGEDYASIIREQFSDVSACNNDELGYLYMGVKHGVITGYPDGTINPSGNITRGEAAAMMIRFINQVAQVQFHVEVYENDSMGVGSVEYISVTGLPDEGIQNALNQNIKDFYLWQWLYKAPDAEPDENYYYGEATYCVIGDRYLSVVQQLDIYSEDHPVNGNSDNTPKKIRAQTFDFLTGESADELIFGGGAYTMANAANKFTQVYPDVDDEAAKALFHTYMQNNEYISNYFLTESYLAIYIENPEGDDFYRFDASFNDIPEMLAKPLADVLGIK